MRAGLLVGGRYRLESVVGAGGMAVVWRAMDTRLQHVVAAKQIHLPRTRDAEVRKRAAMEAEIASALRDHPNVVAVRDVLEDANEMWLILDYIPSMNLHQLVQQRGQLNPGEVAWIGTRVAHALAAGHEQGVLHRDVKPANILISTDGKQVKLSDFGISRRPSDPKLTQSGLVIGTPAYLAPEVARGGTPTAAADMYSLGVTLAEALGDRSPAGEESRTEPGLGSILGRLLNAHPDSRPDAELVAEELRAVETSPSEATLEVLRTHEPDRPPSSVTSVRTAKWSRRFLRPLISVRRHPAVSLIAALVLVVALVSSVIIFQSLRGESSTVPTASSPSSKPSATSPSTSTPSTPPLPPSVGTLTVTGDRRLVDPCPLIDRQALQRFGESVVYPGYTFAGCQAIISAVSGSVPTAFLGVTFELPAEVLILDGQRRSRTNLGGVTIHWLSQKLGSVFEQCDSIIALADNTRINISAYRSISAPYAGIDLCALSDTGITNAMKVLATQGIPYTPTRLEGVNLAKEDACKLFERSRNIVPGLDASAQSASWASWGCSIGSERVGQPFVQYSFQLGDPTNFATSKTFIDDHRTNEALAGRGVYNADSCRVVLEYQKQSIAAPLRNELVVIDVESQDTVDNMCVQAKELVRVAVRKLSPS